ncbi:MAG: hypothetical protein RL308_3251, partial [Bacteroidota bacterium]
NKDIDGNNHFYVKLGLIYYEGESTTYMEVAFYETEKDGLNDMIKKRYIDADDHDWTFQSWGLYDKY